MHCTKSVDATGPSPLPSLERTIFKFSGFQSHFPDNYRIPDLLRSVSKQFGIPLNHVDLAAHYPKPNVWNPNCTVPSFGTVLSLVRALFNTVPLFGTVFS